jgi:acyl-coenzyme A thioesterase 13
MASMADSKASVEDRCKTFLSMVQSTDYTGYDNPALQSTKFISCSPGRTEWELTVTEQMCNPSGNLHGGCAATILDDLTSTPGLTIVKPGFLDRGTVSRTLSCTYLKPLPLGSKVSVLCEVVLAGKTLVHFRGEMRNEKGEPAVTCVHDKVARSSKI